MTSAVAVCLSLISPYMFRIIKGFLNWFLGFFYSSRIESSSRRLSLTSASQAGESQTLLSRNNNINYGTTQTDETDGPLTSREDQRGNEEDHGTIAELHCNGEAMCGSTNDPSQRGAQDQSLKVIEDTSNGQASSSPQIDQIHPNQNLETGPGRQVGSSKENYNLLSILDSAESSREFAWNCVRYVLKGSKNNSESIAVILFIILVFIGVFVAWATVGVLSANIASDGVGLSSSKHCGLWQFDDDAGDEAAYRDDLNNHRKEERSSEYARNCYSTADAIDTLSCRIFYNQSIGFESKRRQKCPFPSSELCYDGLYSAATFDTGYIDASIIGINAPVTHKFRRRSACSPLNMSEPYIRKSQETDDSSYHYNYGSSGSSAYTFNTSGNPFEWLVPIYSMK